MKRIAVYKIVTSFTITGRGLSPQSPQTAGSPVPVTANFLSVFIVFTSEAIAFR